MKLIIAAILMLGSASYAEILRPKTDEPKNFERVTVKITDSKESTGGTGWIVKSTSVKSYIVTNAHVCNLYKRADQLIARTAKGNFQVERIKYSQLHDLCLMEVYTDLGVGVELAEKSPEMGEKVIISGHPKLNPLMLTEGSMSGNLQISIITEINPCTDSEQDRTNLFCKMFGVIPVVKQYESKMTSAIIAPGSSGSAVYNTKGQVVGVAFAGSGDYSQSIIVPLEFLKNFLRSEIKNMNWIHISKSKELYIKAEAAPEENTEKTDVKKIAKVSNLFYAAIEDVLNKVLTAKLK